MNQAACYAGNEEPIVNLQFDRVLQFLTLFLEHTIKSFRLGHCSWKTIEDETGGLID